VIVALWISRTGITIPMSALGDAMQQLADGKLQTVVPGTDRGDELGVMAKTVQVFKDNMIKTQQLEQASREAEERSQQERRKAMLSLADTFEGSVKGVVDSVSLAASEVQMTAGKMNGMAEQTNSQATTVAAAATQATANVETVATAAEELSASIREIAQQVLRSSKVAQSAADEAQTTDIKMRGLADSSTKIGEVVNLINDIASQTNLLALNATIEAARAGDAGKGFAVVANEVKNLANQTGRATDEISQQISSVQNAAREAVEAIASIVKRIAEINEIASSISSAVEEQSAATGEIARNVQQAAQGTQDVSANIGSVTEVASETGIAANQVLGTAKELSNQAQILQNEVSHFLSTVRSA
jgi:methyl-accepting chemotaxis protein